MATSGRPPTLPAALPAGDANLRPPWPLPSGAPVVRRGLCGLAQPRLTEAQHTPRFLFQDATVLLITSGSLDLHTDTQQLCVDTPASLLLVDAGTCADLRKTPQSATQPFRSLFLTLSGTVLDGFRRTHAAALSGTDKHPPCACVPLDDDLAATLRHVVTTLEGPHISDERLQYRLLDLLLALAERGHVFADAGQSITANRLRTLIGDAPDQLWTAREAGRALAMSEATLRRRLAREAVRFEDVLIDVRMHHALMLLQTTAWSIPRIAQACGYQSRARFSERFRSRFGYLPSAVR